MEKISFDFHEHHQHLVQLLSLPLSRGQEKGEHRYFQQFIEPPFTELWCVLAVVDRHRERKSRNLIPARLGIYSIFVFGFHQICEQFAYNALRTKVHTKTRQLLDEVFWASILSALRNLFHVSILRPILFIFCTRQTGEKQINRQTFPILEFISRRNGFANTKIHTWDFFRMALTAQYDPW